MQNASSIFGRAKDSSGVERVYYGTSNEAVAFCTHHEALLCDCTIHYTLLKQARSVTHARISRAITSVVYGRNAENEPVSRIKMADYRVVVSMGTL